MFRRMRVFSQISCQKMRPNLVMNTTLIIMKGLVYSIYKLQNADCVGLHEPNVVEPLLEWQVIYHENVDMLARKTSFRLV